MWENADQNNSECGHFSRSDSTQNCKNCKIAKSLSQAKKNGLPENKVPYIFG